MSDRRDFLRKAAAGLTVSTLGMASAKGSWFREAFGQESGSLPLDADERRRLVSTAHFGRKKGVSSKKGMAVTSHPLASREAVRVLMEGGNACDAALTAAVTQTVVEPHMTTITGCLCLLYYDAATGGTTYLNGDVNTPQELLPRFSAADIATGRGVAVPGYWGGFEAAWQRHATFPKKRILAPAVGYAREGFEIHPFLWGEIFISGHLIGKTREGREIYMPERAMVRPGDVLYQKRAADTLERLAEEGSDYYYRGEFAEKFCKTVQEAGGVIARKDLESYEVRWQEPAWGTYRDYKIAASPPPDNGGTHIIEMLNMIELLDVKKHGPPTDSPEMLRQMVNIHNLVYSEGARQPDPQSHPVPLETILSKEYAGIRLELLQMGNPKLGADRPPNPGSNHVTVVDEKGNVASLLHSCLSMPWSNGLFVEGVSICAAGSHFLRTMPQPGHRASVFLAPNIAFKDGKPILTSGSPSISLLANIVQNTVNILDFGISIEESVHRPRFGGLSYSSPGMSMIEADLDEKVRLAVEKRGVRFELVNPWNFNHGAFEGCYIDPKSGTLHACSDPRRAGQAEGL